MDLDPFCMWLCQKRHIHINNCENLLRKMTEKNQQLKRISMWFSHPLLCATETKGRNNRKYLTWSLSSLHVTQLNKLTDSSVSILVKFENFTHSTSGCGWFDLQCLLCGSIRTIIVNATCGSNSVLQLIQDLALAKSFWNFRKFPTVFYPPLTENSITFSSGSLIKFLACCWKKTPSNEKLSELENIDWL